MAQAVRVFGRQERLAEVIGSLNAAIFESHGAEGPASAGAALGRGDTGRAS